MSSESDFLTLIDLIYETSFDSSLWASVLTKLAECMGATQTVLAALDGQAGTFDSIAPRTDPAMDKSYKAYWAFQDPIWPLVGSQPAGRVFSFDDLVSRQDLVRTPVFNEWYRPAEFGPAILGCNLFLGSQQNVLLCATNSPKKRRIEDEQRTVFRRIAPHINRAARFHREMRLRDFNHDLIVERLEGLRRGMLLVDGAGRVLFANAEARRHMRAGAALSIKGGRLQAVQHGEALNGLIASCARKEVSPSGRGGELFLPCRITQSRLKVTVTPLRSKGAVPQIPWLGLGLPVALVTLTRAFFSSRSEMKKWVQ